MQVDVGFGDVVVPSEQEIEVPSVLGFPAAHLLAYPKATVVAEKLETMIHHGEANSRVRDFLDVWAHLSPVRLLGRGAASRSPGDLLSTENRGPSRACLLLEQLRGRRSSAGHVGPVPAPKSSGRGPRVLRSVVASVEAFAVPVVEALATATGFYAEWSAPGPWKTRS